MNLQIIGIILIVFILVGVGIIYWYIKKLKNSTYQGPKTKLEEGKFKNN